jgi:hypothetical protein
MKINNFIWAGATMGNIFILTALIWRKQWNRLLLIELCSVPIWISQNIMHVDKQWWIAFDVLGILVQLALFANLHCLRIKGISRLVPYLYLLLVITKFYEYALADEGLKELANQIYYCRMPLSIFTSFLMSYAVQSRNIGSTGGFTWKKAKYL